jgi:hypothetical protein
VATTVTKGHGRLEKRTLRTTTILTKHQNWIGLQQGFEVVRERTVQGATTVEVVHGITSLSPERGDATRLLELTRGHWAVEMGRTTGGTRRWERMRAGFARGWLRT